MAEDNSCILREAVVEHVHSPLVKVIYQDLKLE